MPDHLTKAQINQLLNCQDMLKDSLQGLAVATKKMNQATDQIKKENAGIASTSRGSAYYKKIHNSQAAKDAANTIDKLVQKYEENISRIAANIRIFDSQLAYQKNMQELIQYYKNNITKDKSRIQSIESNEAIANRMSTYYQKKEGDAVWYRKYLRTGYWIVVVILSIIILFGLFSGGYMYEAYDATKSAYEMARDHFKAKKTDTNKDNMSGGADEIKDSDEQRHFLDNMREKLSEFQERAKGHSQATIVTSISILVLLLVVPFLVQPVISVLKPILFPYA